MRLGIVIHGHRPDAMAAAHHVVAQLASCGAQVLVEDEVLAAFASGSVTSLNAPDARADVILSLGGDGTLLRGAQYALSWDAALLGVNLGRVGFLAEGEADALPKLLDKVIRGDRAPRSAVRADEWAKLVRHQRRGDEPRRLCAADYGYGAGGWRTRRALHCRRACCRHADGVNRLFALRWRPDYFPESGLHGAHADLCPQFAASSDRCPGQRTDSPSVGVGCAAERLPASRWADVRAAG